MNCSSCGSNLPPAARVCPICGVPTPYNVSQVPDAGTPQYQPTVPASPYGPPQPSNDPTYISSPYGSIPSQPAPPTNYGSQPYGPSQQNPYATSPANPYGAPIPQDPYSAPVQPYPGGFPAPVQPPKRRSRVGLIIGIVVLVLLLACVGLFFALGLAAKNVVTNATATLTATVPTPGATPSVSQGNSPSGLPIDPAASAILTHPQMASAIDSNSDIPTKLATTFVIKQTIYVTYGINTGGHSGYAIAKWYNNGTFAFASSILTVQSNYVNGYFSAYFNIPTNGTVELYWCTQSDCSDAKLAGFATFTVTSASSYKAGYPAVALMAMDRRV